MRGGESGIADLCVCFGLRALGFGLWTQLDFENMRAVAAAVAIGAADEDVAQELHLDLLEARAAAPLALPLAGVEAEGAGVEPALLRQLGLGEDGPDVIERANIDGGIRARGLAEDGLIHQHDPAEVFGTARSDGVCECGVRSRCLRLRRCLRLGGGLRL